MKTPANKSTQLRPVNFFLVPVLPYLDFRALMPDLDWDPSKLEAWPTQYCQDAVLFTLD